MRAQSVHAAVYFPDEQAGAVHIESGNGNRSIFENWRVGELQMKKTLGFFWIMICMLSLSGCGMMTNEEDI